MLSTQWLCCEHRKKATSSKSQTTLASILMNLMYIPRWHDENIHQTDKRWKGFQPEKRTRWSTSLRMDELFNTVSPMIHLQPARCCTSWLILASTCHRTASGASAAFRQPPGQRGLTWTSCRTPCEPSLPPPRLSEPSSCTPHPGLPHSTAHTAIGRGSLLWRWQCSPGCSPPSGRSTHTLPTLSPLLASLCAPWFLGLEAICREVIMVVRGQWWGWMDEVFMMVRYRCMFWGQRFETELVGFEPHLLAFSWH